MTRVLLSDVVNFAALLMIVDLPYVKNSGQLHTDTARRRIPHNSLGESNSTDLIETTKLVPAIIFFLCAAA